MAILNSAQAARAIEVMQEWLKAPPGPDGRTPRQVQDDLDRDRAALIDRELKPLLDSYLSGRTPLPDFKVRIDGINKKHEYWGFKGIKGQMFFNMLVNVADDEAECDQELKAALQQPGSEEIASSRIKTFQSYVKRLGEQYVESGGSKAGRPKVSSVPFFLSYFWQIHQRHVWPVYYTNSVNVMADLNLWQPSEDAAADYIAYKRIHEELMDLFSRHSGRRFTLYDVEHVFWVKGGNPYGGNKPLPPTVSDEPDAVKPIVNRLVPAPAGLDRLPESYIPPIVAVVSQMARNTPELVEAAKRSGISLERAFEKSVNAALTVLGYDTKLLGQGQGRVPDGQALAIDDAYALIWDAKVRADGYSMGTDDRTIKEYVTLVSRELKRRRGLRNIYYMIVSSGFTGDFDDSIRMIKMETDVNEVCLVEADALVAMVDAKMRSPLQVTLGPDGLQRLFAVSGVLDARTVQENLV